MAEYTAKMEHNKETITKLSVTQYNTFEFGKKLVRLVLAIALIVYGLYADQSMTTPVIALVLGCILIANVNLRPRVRANKVIAQINGRFPKSQYSFDSYGFSDSSSGKPIAYSKLIKLVEDSEYFYLYISRESAYMVNKKTVSPPGADGLKEFLGRKTGLDWSRPVTFLNFNIRNIMDKRDRYEGPRLK